MEDQRNWTDASYKTYCRPLQIPFTYRIARGQTVRQQIIVRLSGEPKQEMRGEEPLISLSAPAGRLPEMALAIEPEWMPKPAARPAICRTGIMRLQMRCDHHGKTPFLRSVRDLALEMSAEIDAEIVVGKDTACEGALDEAKSRFEETDIFAGISHCIAAGLSQKLSAFGTMA